MKRIFASILLVTALSCKLDKSSSVATTRSEEVPHKEMAMVVNTIENGPRNAEPYELKVQMSKLENDAYDFRVLMNLQDDSYYVSPNSKRDFKGKFTIVMEETTAIETVSDLIETPLSIEEIDKHPFVNGTVNWVRVNTNYKLKLQRKVTTDFKVSGFIQFTIEPRCSLEKIPFVITNKAGEMTVSINKC